MPAEGLWGWAHWMGIVGGMTLNPQGKTTVWNLVTTWKKKNSLSYSLKSKAHKIKDKNSSVQVQQQFFKKSVLLLEFETLVFTTVLSFKALSLRCWATWLRSFSVKLTGSSCGCMAFLQSKHVLNTGNCWPVNNKERIKHQEEKVKFFISNFAKKNLLSL